MSQLQEAALIEQPCNLPAPSSPLVGREQEVEELTDLLRREDVRLVTLTGPGGTGKTRLALEVAHRMLSHFADGVFFISLAPLQDPELVPAAIADELDVQERGDELILETLKDVLVDRELLLVLDNFEHLMPAALAVSELLSAAPRLHILVTSREWLRLRGERHYPVDPLALPPADRLGKGLSVEEAIAFPAVELFRERAVAALPSFELTARNAAAVAQICVRLDGLPLAIELAAARTQLFTPQALLARLQEANGPTHAAPNLHPLSGGARDLPARQQTLRATIDWSYHLLTAAEQALFRRLAVFAGGCSLEAMEVVCDADPEASPEIMDCLSSLVDKNLLRVEGGPDGEPRFSMLHVIRQYAQERLQRLGEAPALAAHHARYYIGLAEQAEPALTGPEQASWLDRLEIEHDNLRAALHWAGRNREAELGLRLGSALWRFWAYRGHHHEGRLWLDEMLALDERAPLRWRADARFALGMIALDQSDLINARAYHEAGLRLRREVGDPSSIAGSLYGLGIVELEMGEHHRARALLEEGLALFREFGDRFHTANVLIGLASIAMDEGHYAEGRSLLQESLGLFRELGDQQGIAASLNNLGMIALYEGNNERAQQRFEESLEVIRPLESAAFNAMGLVNIGIVAARRGDLAQATAIFAEALQTFVDLDDQVLVAEILERMAAVAGTRRRFERAATLWGAAEALREKVQAPLPPAERREQEQALARIRNSMPADAFAQAWAVGRHLALTDFEELIAFALAQEAPAAPDTTPPAAGHPPDLTPREIEVLRLVAQGLTDAQVAEELVISPRTVSAHLTSIYRKLDVNSRTAATRLALEDGWL